MKVLTYSSLKGGVGKSSLTILTANCLGAAGYRVLVIDMDLNNSVTSYYLTNDTKRLIRQKNIASALSRPDNNLADYAVFSTRRGVDLIASSLFLVDLRGMSERRLAQMLPSISEQYDIVIIDTQPTYDNLVLSAYNAADFIISPFQLSQFDLNTSSFLHDKIRTETDKILNWKLLLNGYDERFSKAKNGSQKEYLELFKQKFEAFLTPESTWTPWTSSVRKIIDRDLTLLETEKVSENQIVNRPLYRAIVNLVENMLGEELLIHEGF